MIEKISIHALRGEGDDNLKLGYGGTKISIHALRGEGDTGAMAAGVSKVVISIHALRGEGDDWRS